MIDGLDGQRVFNLVEALLQEDALLGQHLEDDGLNSIRASIIKMRGDSSTVRRESSPAGDAPRGLARGRVLGEIGDDEDSPFGLAEAPLG